MANRKTGTLREGSNLVSGPSGVASTSMWYCFSSVERRLADAQNTRSPEAVACGFARVRKNGPALELPEGHHSFFLRERSVFGYCRLLANSATWTNRAGASATGALDRVFQLADISRPIVGESLAHLRPPRCLARSAAMKRISRGMRSPAAVCRSSVAARGSLTCTTFSRKYRSWRNAPV